MATSSDYDVPVDLGNVRILQCLQVHQSDVTCCDFALGCGFTFVVTGSSDKLVHVWEWIPGDGFVETVFSPLIGHKYGVTSLQVSPQSSMLITASIDGAAILWKLQTGEKIHSFAQDNGDPIRICRFAPNSLMVVTAGDSGSICIWDLVHRSLMRTIVVHEGIVQALSFTPDSCYLVSNDTVGVMNFWSVDSICDTTNEDCVALLSVDDVHDLGVLSSDFSPQIQENDENTQQRSYTLATSGNDHCIKLWKVTAEVLPKQLNTFSEINFDLIEFLEGHTSAVTCVKFNSDGNLLSSTSLDKTCRVWNLGDDRNSAVLEGHMRYVNCCGFIQNNIFLATGSNDKSIIIWDLTGSLSLDYEFLKTGELSNHNMQENAVAKLGENRENSVTLLQKLQNVHTIAINGCDINKDMILATASSDRKIKLFQFDPEENVFIEMEQSPLTGHTYSVNQVEFSKETDFLVSCSLDGSAIIWNLETGLEDGRPDIANDVLGIRTCRLSYDAKLLFTGGDDEKVTIYDLESSAIVAYLEGHSEAIASIAVTKDTKLLASVCSGGDFRLWSLDDYTDPVFVETEAHDLGVQNCDFSENETPIPNVNYTDNKFYVLATCGNDGLVKLWKISTSLEHSDVVVTEWRVLMGHGGNVNYVRFAPQNGEILCSVATDRQARIWSPYSSACLHVLDHDAMITSCAFSFDSSILVTTCLDTTIWVWKLPQKLIFQNIIAKRLKQHKENALKWTPDDVVRWVKTINLESVADAIINSHVDGDMLLNNEEDDLINLLEIDEEQTDTFTNELKWLKTSATVPDEYLCPITQETMRNPVRCSDGHTYEKSAIEEWFSAGKHTSPMTNEEIEDLELVPNDELREQITSYINSL